MRFEKKIQIFYFRLKQMDNDRARVEKDRHEMGKSFARTADDEDMNDQLKVLRNIKGL